jgi:hypothetical protein
MYDWYQKRASFTGASLRQPHEVASVKYSFDGFILDLGRLLVAFFLKIADYGQINGKIINEPV